MLLKKLTIKDFKGIKEKEVDFTKRTKIMAENGKGKTTIVDSWFWLIANKSSELVENPNIRPMHEEIDECLPTVIADIEVDGKPVQLVKSQKKKVNGEKVALTNSYEINSVPKSEKDFKTYLEELGVELDKLLMLSSTDAFINQMNDKKGRETMRSLLFGMASKITDLDIAKKIPGCKEIVELLKNYKADEIVAMQNHTIKKIKENYGKDGEIITSKIQGLEMSKVDIDVAELELEKSNLEAGIKEIELKILSCNDSKKIDDLRKKKMELDFEINDLRRIENDKLYEQRIQVEDEIAFYSNEIQLKNERITTLNSSLELAEIQLDKAKFELKTAKSDLKKLEKSEFDEKMSFCPTCKRKLEEKEILIAKNQFEADKLESVKSLNSKIDEFVSKTLKINEDIKDFEKMIKSFKAEISKLEKQIDKCKTELEKLPTEPDMSLVKQYKKLVDKKFEIEKQIEELDNGKTDVYGLLEDKKQLQSSLDECNRKIALHDNNIQIDEKIASLNDDRRKYQQEKANCEKVLYQLDLVKQKKNEMLTDEVNKHFDLVGWKLFEFQKNGEIKECCKPLIDGKDFTCEVNNGLQILAKIDILNGLQKFYKQQLPIFVDNFESVSEVTENRIKTKSQLITMAVTEDKELKVV